jgi:hypothetical protein
MASSDSLVSSQAEAPICVALLDLSDAISACLREVFRSMRDAVSSRKASA